MKLKSLLHKSSSLSLCLALLLNGLSFAPVLANDPPPPPDNSQPAPTETFPELFSVETETSSPRPSDPTILREQTVTIHPDVLPFSNSAAELSPINVDLNLFADVQIQAGLTPGELTLSGNRVWSGKAVGQPDSSILFITAPDGTITGNIDVPGGHYQIRPDSGSLHRVEQIDTAAFPNEEEVSFSADSLADVEPQSLSAGQADDGSVIDVMIMYTSQARIAEGGTTKMLQLIDLAVSETNQAYANSGITQRIRLVYTGEVNYTESGDFQTDLYRLTYTGGIYSAMDEVQQLRNDYRADLVSLIIKNSSYCGLSWMMSSLSSSFESRAYSVVSSGCATGNYSLAHEMGHIMGASHDRATDTKKIGLYDYSYGYVASTNAWRTIMAYPTACSSCPRLPYFSNPDIYYGGLPMGVAAGDDAADNRRTLNNTAYTVANFRLSQGAVPATPTTLSPSGTINTALPTFSWNLVSGANQYILTVNNVSAQTIYTLTLNASEVCGSSSCAATPGTTLNPGTYTWYLQASSTNGASPTSVGKTFTVVLPLSTPVLVSPEGNLTTAQPTFKWQEVSGANQYSLVVRDSSGTAVIEKSQIGQSVCSGSTCSYDTGVALYKGNFTWTVMAFNITNTSSSSSNWGTQKAFSLQIAPAAPVPASPTGKIFFDMPLYTWPPVKGTATYTLAVNSSSGAVFSPIALQAANVCTATLCQYSPAVRLPRGAYTWTLKASNEYGESPASSSPGFTVQWLARLPFISK